MPQSYRYFFSSKSKLNTPEEFQQAFQGKQIRSTNFGIFYHSNNRPYPRLGVVVSRKNMPTAVARNCFKRVVRESFRLRQHELGSTDIVVLAYKNARNLSKKELRQCLEQQWEKLMAQQKK